MQAAELVTSLAPMLFEGDVHKKLETICELLLAYRRQFQAMDVAVPPDMPDAMQVMAREVLREKQAISYQTTLIAVRLRPSPSDVAVHLLGCGDSAFFAFSADGEPLKVSLAEASGHRDGCRRVSASRGVPFGPGDQVLVRNEGSLDCFEGLARDSGIATKFLGNWLICTPIDVCRKAQDRNASALGDRVIAPDNILLVPRYLYGQQLESRGKQYRCLDYSSLIRIMPASAPYRSPDGIEHRSSMTAVLPDHFDPGRYDYIEDRFPCGTHFVLCSDGFYSAFATASQMWAWLQAYCIVCADTEQQQRRLEELHGRLHGNGGDDDMSFVWMYPTVPPVHDPDPIGGEKE